jgi:hypothetical protein
VAKLVKEELATGKRFGCSAMAVRAASGGDPAQEMAPTVAVWAGYPPPSVESMQGASARWIDDGGLLGGGGSVGGKIHMGKVLFIGGNILGCRGCGI